jgi:Multiubiquitin
MENEDMLNELDIESFTKENDADKAKPKAKAYRIRIDKEFFKVQLQNLNGEAILELANKTPKTHNLFQKVKGSATLPIGPSDIVDFTAPGVERFQTIALDTTEG